MAKIAITVISAPLPEGWEGTPDEFRQQVFSTLTFMGSGEFLTGQVGGAMPTSNVGIWVDGQDVYVWSEAEGKYVPITAHPIGSAIPFFGSIISGNYLLCDGAQYKISDYPALYGVIGQAYKWATESGTIETTHFRVPDLRGRTPFGCGVGEYNPTKIAGPEYQMREILLHQYDGLEWPRRINTKHVNQPPATTSPGDCLVYTGAAGANYTRSMPPHIGCNWIIRAK